MFNFVNPYRCSVAAPSTTWSTVVVQSAAALEPYVSAWQALAAATVEPNVFYEPWLLLPALRALGGQTRFRFVLIFARSLDAEPVLSGFFPLTHRRGYRRLPVSTLGLWVHPYLPLGTPLIRADALRPCLDAFFRWLASDRHSAALMDFDGISADGPFAAELAAQVQARRCPMLLTAHSERALFRRGTGSEEYLKTALSSDQRKSLRRKAKRLAEVGPVAYRSLEADGDVEPWLDGFLRLEATGWKGRAGTALAQHPAEKSFFETAIRAAHRLGRLQAFALGVGGRPIAYQIYFTAGAGAFAYKTAYDEEYARFSPGTLIQTELVHRLHERPECEWMDSCSESDGYLNQLWKERRSLQTLVVAPGALAGRLALAALPRLQLIYRFAQSTARESINQRREP
jgi:CelD/BcsL family acetyltransferase involved in cellulose biosynthesis